MQFECVCKPQAVCLLCGSYGVLSRGLQMLESLEVGNGLVNSIIKDAIARKLEQKEMPYVYHHK